MKSWDLVNCMMWKWSRTERCWSSHRQQGSETFQKVKQVALNLNTIHLNSQIVNKLDITNSRDKDRFFTLYYKKTQLSIAIFFMGLINRYLGDSRHLENQSLANRVFPIKTVILSFNSFLTWIMILQKLEIWQFVNWKLKECLNKSGVFHQ